MFHFPRFPPGLHRVMGRAPTGLPHSDSLGSLAASASPRHFAAWPRPSSAAIAKASTLRPSSGRLTTSRFLTRSSDQNSFAQPHQTGSRQRQDEPTTVTHLPQHRLRLGLPVQDMFSARQDSCFTIFVSMQCAWMIRHDKVGLHPRPQDSASLAWRVVKLQSWAETSRTAYK